MIDQVDDGIMDQEGAFGVNWLLRISFGSRKMIRYSKVEATVLHPLSKWEKS